MQKIVPHLWFDKEARDAAEFYVTLFEDSKILNLNKIQDTPSGEVEIVDFMLSGMNFSAISAGPYFTFNPSVSLMVSCKNAEEVDRLYKKLSPGGMDLMPLGGYPFSKRYAWVQDKFGLSWQLFLTENIESGKRIRPNLLFSQEVCGRAEEALSFYASVFEEVSKGFTNYYQEGEAFDKRARINYSELNLFEKQFILMDHGQGGDFTFSEAFSFMVMCKNQEEIDYYWEKLSYVPEAEQCGWIKDKFGLSWQIVPENLNKLLSRETEVETKKAYEKFLKMKKIDIAALKAL